MSEATRSIQVEDISDADAAGYLMQIMEYLNRIAKAEDEKADVVRSYNGRIKGMEGSLEELRMLLNDGIITTVHNFMNNVTHEIDWKDEGGNVIESTPFDDEDWDISAAEAQRSLFPDELDADDPPGDEIEKHPPGTAAQVIAGMEKEEDEDLSPGLPPSDNVDSDGYPVEVEKEQ